ncbi:MAG TPA: PIN domain-containing protein [Mycobacteriales bacterium]|nr:PIN domain-containing protein [Mycobacteriales bacterium]
MIVLDANVLIAHLGAADALHDRAVELLVDLADEPLGVSPLTLAEVYVGPARAGKLEVAERAIRALDIAPVPLRPDAPLRLAELRAATGLRLPDCCVLLAAETAGAELATFDDRVTRAAGELGLLVR